MENPIKWGCICTGSGVGEQACASLTLCGSLMNIYLSFAREIRPTVIYQEAGQWALLWKLKTKPARMELCWVCQQSSISPQVLGFLQ